MCNLNLKELKKKFRTKKSYHSIYELKRIFLKRYTHKKLKIALKGRVKSNSKRLYSIQMQGFTMLK